MSKIHLIVFVKSVRFFLLNIGEDYMMEGLMIL